jgi:urease subunit gamma/beta
MALTPGESDRLLLHLQASLAQRRRDRGLLLNIPEATALIADAVCEWARDGLGMAETRERARTLLTSDDLLPGVTDGLDEVRVEARFDDGTRLVVVKDPFGIESHDEDDGVEPPGATAAIDITNEAPTAIGLTSHIHLAEVNPRLRLDRRAAFGMRPAVRTGETVWIRPAESVRLPMLPIAGERIVVGNTGVVDGRLDDPEVRERALGMLRACGYLDIVNGEAVGDIDSASGAVAALMQLDDRRGERA